MSFDDFLRYKGGSISEATRQEACHYVFKHGQHYCLEDYIWFWRSNDRDAFWKALYWSERAKNEELTLHDKCSAIRQARAEWKRFQSLVRPVAHLEPCVPPLPE